MSEWPTTPRCLEENKGLGDSELSLWFQHFGISAFFQISIIPFLHFSFLFAFWFCSSLASDVFAFQGLLEIAVCQVHLQCFSWSKTRLNAILEPYWNQSQVLFLAFSFCFNHLNRHILSFFSFLSFFCMLILFHCFFLRFSLWTKPLQTVNSHYRNCDSSGKQLATTAYSSSQHHKQPCWQPHPRHSFMWQCNSCTEKTKNQNEHVTTLTSLTTKSKKVEANLEEKKVWLSDWLRIFHR